MHTTEWNNSEKYNFSFKKWLKTLEDLPALMQWYLGERYRTMTKPVLVLFISNIQFINGVEVK